MIVHLDGSLVPGAEARVSVFDRGFLFGDGVYEGLRASDGHVIAIGAHVRRMREGLAKVRIEGFDPGALPEMTRELLRANGLEDAFVYWQVTRGVPAPGEPARARIPGRGCRMRPTVLGFATPQSPITSDMAPGVRTAVVAPDLRWRRGLIKCVSLMGGVLAAIEADEAGAEDAVMVREGLVAESVAANVFIAKDGVFATPALDSAPILAGVTRGLLLRADASIEERPVTEEELRQADEVMLVGTTTLVAAVTHLDGRPVGRGEDAGRPGPMCRRLMKTLLGAIERDRAAADVH